ncbi:MAG: 1-acyl-sn-glycerol-3-phosphate acyltransferase [Paracoccaceae bacterium]|nr:1-acyl-sn-glycerol-3-phosphate acyltransferase [Paracoccaceae bacterium]
MKDLLQLVRSFLFNVQMYLAMAVIGLGMLPFALISRDAAYRAIHAYCWWVRWTASWMVGLRSEIRGTPPDDEVLIASKHQSFLDIILIVSVTPRPKFIMKKQLIWAPILGWYAARIGCIAVDRGKRSAAIKKMVADVRSGSQVPGQLIIFPQGTRVAAGVSKPYKVGVGALYKETGQACVPVATNVGVFWKRHGVMRRPGLAVVEFLPRVEPGKEVSKFMAHLEEEIESNSNRLMAEAGFTGEGQHQAG